MEHVHQVLGNHHPQTSGTIWCLLSRRRQMKKFGLKGFYLVIESVLIFFITIGYDSTGWCVYFSGLWPTLRMCKLFPAHFVQEGPWDRGWQIPQRLFCRVPSGVRHSTCSDRVILPEKHFYALTELHFRPECWMCFLDLCGRSVCVCVSGGHHETRFWSKLANKWTYLLLLSPVGPMTQTPSCGYILVAYPSPRRRGTITVHTLDCWIIWVCYHARYHASVLLVLSAETLETKRGRISRFLILWQLTGIDKATFIYIYALTTLS